MLKPILACLAVIVILIMSYVLITSGKDTAGFLAIVTALVPLLTLLLKPSDKEE